MTLFLVVHHRQDPTQNWGNSWLDDELLESITTTSQIGRLCQDAMKKNERVFIHRCGWGDSKPVICCTVKVAQSSSIDTRTSFVKFGEQQGLSVPPSDSPYPGQNYYQT